MNALLIHGTYGNPEENWFPWLKEELEKLDCSVFVPKFPTPKNQDLESWFKVFDDYTRYLDKDSILIGHSLGVAFTLNILERSKCQINAAFLVAGFLGLLNDTRLDKLNKTFTEKRFDWNKIKKNCKKFFIYSSDDDPYVPLEKGKELAKNLETELIVVHGAKHFNKDAGYIKFPLLVKDIKGAMRNYNQF